ncbi:MAG: M20/M25/M40 family metallo-hydrolase [Ignavibacteriaceae bacterium]|nr:M20/M25/M40 family metallo-hydrolase [Ignavibacteriaceae bacterium]
MKILRQVYLIALYLLISFELFAQIYSNTNSNLISKKDLLEKVSVLTSDEFEGRLSGSDGYNKAAAYSAELFKSFNLKPAGDEGYFQNLKVEYNKILQPAVFNLLKEGKVFKEYELGRDFIFRGFTGSADVKAQVVFCGYGISQPEDGFDDYKDVNVNGKIVMVFKYHPRWQKEGIEIKNGSIREKSRLAFEHGAKAIIFVSFPNDKKPQGVIGSILDGEGEHLITFPQLHISIEAADDILEQTGYKLKDLQSKIDSTKQSFSFNTYSKVHVIATAEYNKQAPTMNVVGIIEGSDSVLKKEFIVIGAHLDHVGSQAGKVIFYGANDNASGSAGVIQIAETLSKSRSSLKRSVIFVLFASEELGLFGSKHFVKSPPVNPDKIVAMLNLDCIGHGDSIQIGNGKSAPVLWQLIKKIDEKSSGLMVERTWAGGGADASPFHDIGIPSAYFVTTNSYEHLHERTDRVDTLNPELYEAIVNLAYSSLIELASGNYQKEKIVNEN